MLTPHTAHRTPHTAHRTPHNSQLTTHEARRTTHPRERERTPERKGQERTRKRNKKNRQENDKKGQGRVGQAGKPKREPRILSYPFRSLVSHILLSPSLLFSPPRSSTLLFIKKERKEKEQKEERKKGTSRGQHRTPTRNWDLNGWGGLCTSYLRTFSPSYGEHQNVGLAAQTRFGISEFQNLRRYLILVLVQSAKLAKSILIRPSVVRRSGGWDGGREGTGGLCVGREWSVGLGGWGGGVVYNR